MDRRARLGISSAGGASSLRYATLRYALSRDGSWDSDGCPGRARYEVRLVLGLSCTGCVETLEEGRGWKEEEGGRALGSEEWGAKRDMVEVLIICSSLCLSPF